MRKYAARYAGRRPIVLALLCSIISWVCATELSAASPATRSSPRVATIVPIAHSLTTGLLEGTEVRVDYLPPTRLPANRISHWIKKNASTHFEPYDVLVSISDAVPSLKFSTTLRQSNIRLVTVDIAYARVPSGERVVIDQPNEYFWLNTHNLLLMLGILHRDLSSLWPAHAAQISANYRRMSRAVRRYELSIEAQLLDRRITAMVLEKPTLRPLAASLSLDTTSEQEAAITGLPALRVTTKRVQRSSTELLKRSDWLIDDLSRFSDKTLTQRLHDNLRDLMMALG